MDDLIKFFVFTERLKFLPRRRWEVLGIKDPDTVGDHIYMVTFLAWLFSFGRDFDSRKIFIGSLAHGLDLVFPNTQETYIKILKENPASLYTEVLEKIQLTKMHRDEKASLNKLLKYSSGFREEIRKLWDDVRLVKSKEAKFLDTIDKLENLIQAISYKKQIQKSALETFWTACYKSCDDDVIKTFLDSLKEYDEHGEKAVKNKENQKLIKFVYSVANLKKIKRRGWVIRGVKNPDSIASHSALAALMIWFLSKNRKLDQGVMFIMELLHDLSAAEVGDISPHDAVIEKTGKSAGVVEHFPWVGLRHEKEFIMRKTLETKSTAIEKILKPLPHQFRHELKYLWLEFETGTSPEARFTRQVDRIETVIQVMEYYIQDRTISPTSFWLGLKELIDDHKLYEFVETIDNYYFNKQMLAKDLVPRG